MRADVKSIGYRVRFCTFLLYVCVRKKKSYNPIKMYNYYSVLNMENVKILKNFKIICCKIKKDVGPCRQSEYETRVVVRLTVPRMFIVILIEL